MTPEPLPVDRTFVWPSGIHGERLERMLGTAGAVAWSLLEGCTFGRGEKLTLELEPGRYGDFGTGEISVVVGGIGVEAILMVVEGKPVVRVRSIDPSMVY